MRAVCAGISWRLCVHTGLHEYEEECSQEAKKQKERLKSSQEKEERQEDDKTRRGIRK